MATADDLIKVRDGYLQALVDDALSGPAMSYAIDGESLDRNRWREHLRNEIKELTSLIIQYQPFELRTQIL